MICILPRRKTAADYHDLAKSRGINWIEKRIPTNTRTAKTKWKCDCGHIWLTTYATIQCGSGCPKCSRKKVADDRRKSPSDYKALANRFGYTLTGTVPPRTHISTSWICPNGHRVKRCYNAIQRGQVCNQCHLDNKRFHMSDYLAMEKKNGLRFVGTTVPPNVHTPVEWECKNGCRLKKQFRHVTNYVSCPNCPPYRNGKLVSKAQIEISEITGGVLNYMLDGHAVDVAIINEQIAIEYDSWYWHSHRSSDDRKRNTRIKAAGWKLLVIRSNSRTPTKQQIDYHLNKLKNGFTQTLMRLSDWGRGSTLVKVLNRNGKNAKN